MTKPVIIIEFLLALSKTNEESNNNNNKNTHFKKCVYST